MLALQSKLNGAATISVVDWLAIKIINQFDDNSLGHLAPSWDGRPESNLSHCYQGIDHFSTAAHIQDKCESNVLDLNSLACSIGLWREHRGGEPTTSRNPEP